MKTLCDENKSSSLKIIFLFFSIFILVLIGCDGGNGGSDDDGADSGDSPPVDTLIQDGVFTICGFHADNTGLSWDVNSEVFDVDFDGIDTIYVDKDRDGDFSDDDVNFTGDDDGTIMITDGPTGAFSEDESTIALTEVVLADMADFSIGLREGTGLDLDTFDGPYLVTKFAVNTATAVAHTYAIIATRTGADIGAFRVVASSNAAAVNIISPFTYDVEDNGNIIFDDSHEEGKIKSDGSFFIASDSDPTNDFETIMVGMKSAAGDPMATSDLQGEFIVNLIGRNLTSGDYIASRILATFDGVGLVHYEFIEGGSDEGFAVYGVNPEGILIMAIPPSGYQYGSLSSDGNIFTVIDTNLAGAIYLMVGIKKH